MVGIEHREDQAAELRRMAVQKAQRRKGIARELLATAEAFSRDRGYRRIVLSTSELQVAARRLYESSGYRLVREEKNAAASHKSVGAGLTRYHYEKALR
jgi:ribosomal protein S18 acetylase RimI-like enzyme